MAQTITKVERVRLNLAVTPAVRDRLDELKALAEAESLTEVIRRALTIYKEYLLVQKAGGRVIIEDREGAGQVLRIV